MNTEHPHDDQRRKSPLDVPLKSLSFRSLPGRDGATPDPELVERVRGEFNEMRGFSPTLDQVARLFNLPKDECTRVLGLLLDEGFLGCRPDGRYRLSSR